MMLGPLLGPARNFSVQFFEKFFNKEIIGCPNVMMPAVDVREVAKFAYIAVTKEGIDGMRFPLCNKNMKFVEIASILKREFKPHGYKIYTNEMGYITLKLASLVIH